MKLAVVGSRTFTNRALLTRIIVQIKGKYGIELIISGGAKGTDTIAEGIANLLNIPTLIFLPDWETYGKKAGFIRNKNIISNATHVLAVWDGKSKGTKHSIDLAYDTKKPIKILRFL